MKSGNCFIVCILLISFCSLASGQNKRKVIADEKKQNNKERAVYSDVRDYRMGTLKVERMIFYEKALENEIINLENNLKQLKQRQIALRKKINNQIENELKQAGEAKEKLVSENSKTKTEKEKITKRRIERADDHIQKLKTLKEELKSNWKEI